MAAIPMTKLQNRCAAMTAPLGGFMVFMASSHCECIRNPRAPSSTLTTTPATRPPRTTRLQLILPNIAAPPAAGSSRGIRGFRAGSFRERQASLRAILVQGSIAGLGQAMQRDAEEAHGTL